MGLLKHFRSKSRLKDAEASHSNSYDSAFPIRSHPRYGQPDLITRLPERVLGLIFSFVCPHTRDTSFFPSEESQIGDGCMLCDLRDLARCAQVSRKWYSIAQGLLYRSVRIDAVHYCELEEELAEKRRKAAKFRTKKEVEPVDVPHIRLQLFARSVRENPSLGAQVQILKLPYMTRETAKGDLARAVSALPNLRYVDLPDGFYSGDLSCRALRHELQVRCPDIRKMTYRAGSEEALELLAQRHWQSLEILELSQLAIEPATLRIVLASLPTLHELTLSDMTWMDDSVFQPTAQLPDFPPLQALKMVNIPNVSAQGLKAYMQAPHNREMFFSLTLKNTGLKVPELPTVLWAASNLQHLSITETVSKSLGLNTQELASLTSISLKTLHYEIMSSEEVHGLQKPADSYYAYLANSLHHNALPALETLYVRDQNFPDLLLMPPLPAHQRSASATSSGSTKSKGSNLSAISTNMYLSPPGGNGAPAVFNQKLEVFSKGIDEVEWVFTSIAPPSGSHKGSASGGRPLSAFSASRGLGPQWAQGGFGGEARKSVVVGNGFGGFLAIPQEEAPRPMSAGYMGGPRWGSVATESSEASSFLKPPPSMSSLSSSHVKRQSKHDLWR